MASNSTGSTGGIPPALQAQINDELGSVFIGLVIAASIFGVTNVQCFMYFNTYSKRDPLYLKAIVSFLLILDWMQLIFASHGVYTYTISNFANISFLTSAVWSIVAQVIVSAISDMTVQLCYCWRIWVLSKKNLFLTGVAVLLAVLCCVFSLTFSGIILQFSSLLQYSSASWALYCASATAVAGDAWIAVVLVFYLTKSKTGWKQSDTTATRLMVYIVNTGLLTTVVVTASLITFATMPTSNAYIAIYLSYSKLYFNALLAMLNARDALRGDVHTHFMASSHLRETGSTSQNSEGTVFKMSRLLPLGRAKDRTAEVGVREIPQVVIGRLDDKSDGQRILSDRSTSSLKRSPDGGVVINVQTDMVHQADLDTDDGRSDSDKYRAM